MYVSKYGHNIWPHNISSSYLNVIYFYSNNARLPQSRFNLNRKISNSPRQKCTTLLHNSTLKRHVRLPYSYRYNQWLNRTNTNCHFSVVPSIYPVWLNHNQFLYKVNKYLTLNVNVCRMWRLTQFLYQLQTFLVHLGYSHILMTLYM